MLVDISSKLFIARATKHVGIQTFRNAIALLLPVVDELDPSGIVFNDRVIRNRRRVIIFGRLQGKNGSLLSPLIMAG